MKNFLILLVLLSLCVTLNAETVYLKNGNKDAIKILKKTDSYIRGESQGMPVVYFTEEIDHVAQDSPKEETSYNEAMVDTALNAYDVISTGIWLKEQAYLYLVRYDNRLDNSMLPAVKDIIDSVYDGKLFYSVAKDAFYSQFDRERVYALNQYLQRPDILLVNSARRDIFDDPAKTQFDLFREEIQLVPQDKIRTGVIDKLDDISSFSQFTFEFVKVAVDTIAKNQGIKDHELKALVKENTRKFLYFVYRNVDIPVIEEHCKIATDKDIRWFDYLVRSAIMEANVLASNMAAKKIDDYVTSVMAQRSALEPNKKKKKVKTATVSGDDKASYSNLVSASWVDKK